MSTKKKRPENRRQLQAYELYYSQGDKRSMTKVAKVMQACIHTVYKWKSLYHWADRIEVRERKIAKRIQQKVDKDVVHTKLSYRSEINDNLRVIRSAILSAIDPETRQLLVTVKTVSDIARLSTAYENLVRLDLEILGDIEEVDQEAPIFKLVNALSGIIAEGKPSIDKATTIEEVKTVTHKKTVILSKEEQKEKDEQDHLKDCGVYMKKPAKRQRKVLIPKT